MLDRDKMHVNKKNLLANANSVQVLPPPQKRGDFDASFKPRERDLGVWQPLVGRKNQKILAGKHMAPGSDYKI